LRGNTIEEEEEDDDDDDRARTPLLVFVVEVVIGVDAVPVVAVFVEAVAAVASSTIMVDPGV
jgi:hypothetical protein